MGFWDKLTGGAQQLSNALVPDEAIKTESVVTFKDWGKVVTIFVLGIGSLLVLGTIIYLVVKQNK